MIVRGESSIVQPVQEVSNFFFWNNEFVFSRDNRIDQQFPGEVVFNLFYRVEVDQVLPVQPVKLFLR